MKIVKATYLISSPSFDQCPSLKADKEKPGVVARNVKSFFDALNEILPFLPQGFVTSAEKRTGVEEVVACIDQYNKLDAEGL